MRYAAIIEYNGAAYAGWQRQLHAPSVQAQVEAAFSRVANVPVEILCAGRTDAGVHGTHQVVHFDCDAARPDRAWVLGANNHLPADIAVRWAGRVADDFHARFSALARRYRYLIANQTMRSGLAAKSFTIVPEPLSAVLMHEAAQYFVGEQDFSAVRAASCQALTAARNVHHVRVSRIGQYVLVDIAANAFLHHMVRNIVGVLLEVGTGRQPPDWPRQLLQSRDRALAASTASAAGLHLVGVRYPLRFQMPLLPAGPWFLPDSD